MLQFTRGYVGLPQCETAEGLVMPSTTLRQFWARQFWFIPQYTHLRLSSKIGYTKMIQNGNVISKLRINQCTFGAFEAEILRKSHAVENLARVHVNIPMTRTDMTRLCNVASNCSLDWFKGKCTVKPPLMVETHGFRVRFSQEKPIQWIVP